MKPSLLALVGSVVVAAAALGCGGATDGTSAPAPAAPFDGEVSSFVAVGDQTFALSTDGAPWDARPFGFAFVAQRVASAHGRVVAIGRATKDDDAARLVAVTSDLRTWHLATLPFDGCSATDIAVVGDRFVVTGMSWSTGSCAAASRDGETWSIMPGVPTSHMFHAIVRGRDTLIASAWRRSDLMTPAVYEERGGAFAELVYPDAPLRGAGGFTSAVDMGDRIALVQRDGNVWAWDDLSRFEPTPDGPEGEDASWSSLVHAGTKLLTIGELRGYASRGAVGLRGHERDAPVRIVLRRTEGRIWGAAFARGRFVVVGARGYAAESDDGERWTEHQAGSHDLADVVAAVR